MASSSYASTHTLTSFTDEASTPFDTPVVSLQRFAKVVFELHQSQISLQSLSLAGMEDALFLVLESLGSIMNLDSSFQQQEHNAVFERRGRSCE
jgi:hypothetical protein